MAAGILALNAGSSSLKFGLFDGTGVREVLRGSVSAVYDDAAHFQVRDGRGQVVADARWTVSEDRHPVERLITWIENHLGGDELVAAGHRVVHGGRAFSGPVVIDKPVLERLEALTPLAPLHQPTSLAPIYQLSEFRPNLLQVACFDTAFHHDISSPANRYAIPRALEAEGIRRYGFHGLSYEAIATVLAARGDGAADERIVVGHLGSGASLCAMKRLRSVDTTMGFSTLDGIVMGTRPGSIDPGILLYLLREKGYSLDRLEHWLYNECGLAGVSAITSDVRALLASGAVEAREALDLFAFSVATHVAMLATSLGGIDRLVFTGGIGENAWQVREMIAARLGWLGIALDAGANAANASTISAIQSRIRVEVIPTDEEGAIARHAARFLP